jgi:hypothetical protein
MKISKSNNIKEEWLIPPFMILLLVSLFSCSSNKVLDTSNPNNSNSVLVKKVTYSNVLSAFVFIYNGNKLVKYGFEDGSESKIFTYQGDLISRTEWVNSKNVSIGEATVYNYTNNKLTQSNTFFDKILGQTRDYVYSTSGTIEISTTDYQDNGSSVVVKSKQYFDSLGNIIRDENFRYITPSVINYTYDKKNNPFKNITGYNIISVNGVNNIIARTTNSDTQTNIYQYNDQNYPISCSSTSNGKITTTSYSYY